MDSLVRGILVFSLAVAPGFASTLFFQGTFAADDQVALFSFTLNTNETITIQTDSYAGGDLDSVPVSAGGFVPSAFIFDNMGDELDLSTYIGNCAQVGLDPTTGACNDLYYQAPLGPGTFTLALAVDNNTPLGGFASDGFVEDGNPGFTCQEAGTSGSFCDVTTAFGASRTGNYDIAITGADSAVNLPEPGSFLLLFAGGAFIVLRRRRFSSRPV
jgi:hypothetical protein